MFDLDKKIGLGDYLWQEKSTGGKIKSFPEDFIVQEVHPLNNSPITLPPTSLFCPDRSNGGLYLSGRVWKKNIDHWNMIKNIAKSFNVSSDDVETAGIKDKNAITIQYFSVFQPKKIPNDPCQIDDNLEIDNFYYSKEKKYPGSMAGNYFTISIREFNNDINQELLNNFGLWASKLNIPNYFGLQRFGGSNISTVEFGRKLLNNNYEAAINYYIINSIKNKSIINQEEEIDPNYLLTNWINIPSIERRILNYLSKHPGNYKGAVKYFPRFLINLASSSFVSLLTNNYIKQRVEIDKLLTGERIKNNNIEIALPSKRWKNPSNHIWQDIFNEFNVKIDELKKINFMSRFLWIDLQNWSSNIEADKITVSFQLPKGSYATIVLRELMQVIPDNLI